MWPPDYDAVRRERHRLLTLYEDRTPHTNRLGKKTTVGEEALRLAKIYYRHRHVEFINTWCDTFDPRGGLNWIPFCLFPTQEELIEFFAEGIKSQVNLSLCKSRDLGATWCAVSFSTQQFLFEPDVNIGWGSRGADQVDRLGDMSSIFEKIRQQLSRPHMLVWWPLRFNPKDHMMSKRIIRPDSNASIVGEIGDNIGRGGRTSYYFKDESSHYEHPIKIESSLSATTQVQIDVSSVSHEGFIFKQRVDSATPWKRGEKMQQGTHYGYTMPWTSHPARDKTWYDQKKKFYDDIGAPAVFQQEYEMNFNASIDGQIIPHEWLVSCINAHKTLKGMRNGQLMAGFDVADQGGDTNALAIRDGAVLIDISEWGGMDAGASTRRVLQALSPHAPIDCQYDVPGVGSAVTSERNRMSDNGSIPQGIDFVAWHGGTAVQNPDQKLVPGDDSSNVTNKQFFGNFKAQSWWRFRQRVFNTWRAITQEIHFDNPVEDFFSIDQDAIGIAMTNKLCNELSQPVRKPDSNTQKMIVDKKPEGSKSPNCGDATVMCYNPMRVSDNMEWVFGNLDEPPDDDDEED